MNPTRRVIATWAFWGIGYKDLWAAYCAAHRQGWDATGGGPDVRELRAWVDQLSDEAWAMLTLNVAPRAGQEAAR